MNQASAGMEQVKCSVRRQEGGPAQSLFSAAHSWVEQGREEH